MQKTPQVDGHACTIETPQINGRACTKREKERADRLVLNLTHKNRGKNDGKPTHTHLNLRGENTQIRQPRSRKVSIGERVIVPQTTGEIGADRLRLASKTSPMPPPQSPSPRAPSKSPSRRGAPFASFVLRNQTQIISIRVRIRIDQKKTHIKVARFRSNYSPPSRAAAEVHFRERDAEISQYWRSYPSKTSKKKEKDNPEICEICGLVYLIPNS